MIQELYLNFNGLTEFRFFIRRLKLLTKKSIVLEQFLTLPSLKNRQNIDTHKKNNIVTFTTSNLKKPKKIRWVDNFSHVRVCLLSDSSLLQHASLSFSSFFLDLSQTLSTTPFWSLISSFSPNPKIKNRFFRGKKP